MKMSPWQEAKGGAMCDYLSMVKRHTRKAGPRDPRLEVMEQRRRSSKGRMRRCRTGSVRIEMSVARSMHNTWKDSSAAEVSWISLWRVLTPDM